ncbi:MAG: hypothetical protein ACXABK_06385 [Candidatus Heimdallarchaeaceae archaeon]
MVNLTESKKKRKNKDQVFKAEKSVGACPTCSEVSRSSFVSYKVY